MPTYEFRCPECRAERNVIRPIQADDLVYCDDCDIPMNKRYRPVPPVFKGEGFYTTDKFTDR